MSPSSPHSGRVCAARVSGVDSDIRSGRRGDVRELSHTLGRAFHDDPVMSWMLPDPCRRAVGLPHMFATRARYLHLHEEGGIEVARDGGRIVGATLWDPPGQGRPNRLRQLLMKRGMKRAFGARRPVAFGVSAYIHQFHPDEPHWYLAMIGTDPSARGAGHGRALLDSRLSKCDAEHCPAYLVSSKASNVAYYERFGFAVRKEITIPDGGPTLWGMWRDPR